MGPKCYGTWEGDILAHVGCGFPWLSQGRHSASVARAAAEHPIRPRGMSVELKRAHIQGQYDLPGCSHGQGR